MTTMPPGLRHFIRHGCVVYNSAFDQSGVCDVQQSILRLIHEAQAKCLGSIESRMSPATVGTTKLTSSSSLRMLA